MLGWNCELGGEVMADGTDAPRPESVFAGTEACRRLLGLLREPRLKRVALAKLEGLTDAEIAERIGCSVRTIERELVLVRKLWEHAES